MKAAAIRLGAEPRRPGVNDHEGAVGAAGEGPPMPHSSSLPARNSNHSNVPRSKPHATELDGTYAP